MRRVLAPLFWLAYPGLVRPSHSSPLMATFSCLPFEFTKVIFK